MFFLKKVASQKNIFKTRVNIGIFVLILLNLLLNEKFITYKGSNLDG